MAKIRYAFLYGHVSSLFLLFIFFKQILAIDFFLLLGLLHLPLLCFFYFIVLNLLLSSGFKVRHICSPWITHFCCKFAKIISKAAQANV